jgi:FtsH-binding integral membrane protein
LNGIDIPGVIVRLMIGISGLLGGITVLLAQRNQKLTPDMELVISLVCADILLCSTVIVYDISNLAGGGWVVQAARLIP